MTWRYSFFFKWYKDKLTKNSYVSLWRAHSVYTINHPVVLLMLKSTEHCIKVIWIPFKCNFELINIRRTSYFFCFELIIWFIFLLRWAEHFLLAFNNVHSCTEVRCLFFFIGWKRSTESIWWHTGDKTQGVTQKWCNHWCKYSLYLTYQVLKNQRFCFRYSVF